MAERPLLVAVVCLVASSALAGVEPPEIDLRGVEPAVRGSIESAAAVVRVSPDSTDAWGELAVTLDAHQFAREAIACYKQAANLAPKDARWRYLAAVALATTDFAAARAEFATAFELGIDHSAAHWQFGRLLTRLGEIEAAAARFRSALERDPSAAFARADLARVQWLLGQSSAARANLQQVLVTRPKLGIAHALQAQLDRAAGDLDGARVHAQLAERYPLSSSFAPADPLYAKVVAAGASSRWLRSRGRSLLAKGRPAAAESEFRRLIELRPEDAFAYDLLGNALTEQGRFEEAIAAFGEALERDGAAASIHGNLGVALMRSGALEAAVESLERAVSLDGEYVEGHLTLGLIWARRGDHRRATDAFTRAVAADPVNAEALHGLALTFAQVGKLGEASDLWRRAVQANPGHLASWSGLASTAIRRSEHATAVADLRRALSLLPGTPQLLSVLAWELATAPDATVRSGAEAVELANELVRAVPMAPQSFDILAAALAETGEFQAATRTAEHALKLAGLQRRVTLSRQIGSRLELYRATQTYRQSQSSDGPR